MQPFEPPAHLAASMPALGLGGTASAPDGSGASRTVAASAPLSPVAKAFAMPADGTEPPSFELGGAGGGGPAEEESSEDPEELKRMESELVRLMLSPSGGLAANE